MTFLTDQFLLGTPTARKLYADYAAKQPIIDYHCHVSPQEIFEDKQFENLYEVWLSGDHYKWRIMRSNGVDESYITGDRPAREKFQKFAEALPKAIGNPMYHWCHLELKNYFGFDGVLNGDTAEEVWQLAEEKLKDPAMSVRGIIQQSNVAFIGTTDDPIDSLEWHQQIAADDRFDVTVAPTFRPDKALNIEKADWRAYIAELSRVAGLSIQTVADLKEALKRRIEHFDACGCKASDHGLDYMVYRPTSIDEVETIMKTGLAGDSVTIAQAEAFKTELLLFCAAEYARKGWAMQLHYNCLRNPNTRMFATLGADKGFDCIGPHDSCAAL